MKHKALSHLFSFSTATLAAMPGEVEVEKPTEEASAEKEKVTTPAAKSVVGIIYPPPEVRSILKTMKIFINRHVLVFI